MPTTKKKVKGTEYLYFTYYDQSTGKKKEIYCGSASDINAQAKSLELELEYVKSKIKDYENQSRIIKQQLKKIKID